MSMYGRQIENHIEREVADAINERDIEIIIMIRAFKERNSFEERGDSKASKTAFDFACDEIIKLIDQSE